MDDNSTTLLPRSKRLSYPRVLLQEPSFIPGTLDLCYQEETLSLSTSEAECIDSYLSLIAATARLPSALALPVAFRRPLSPIVVCLGVADVVDVEDRHRRSASHEPAVKYWARLTRINLSGGEVARHGAVHTTNRLRQRAEPPVETSAEGKGSGRRRPSRRRAK